MNKETIGLISTFAGLLPVLAGTIVFKKAGFKHRLLIFFLLYGFLTDLFVKLTSKQELIDISKNIFYLYFLVEAMFFSWFTSKSCDYEPVTKTALIFVFIFPFAWLYAYFPWISLGNDPADDLYNAVYKMIVTVLSSYAILSLTRKDEKLPFIPDFWFLSAIFFYCICTFFFFYLLKLN